MSEFQRELEIVINRHSRENSSDTPDFILAEFLNEVLSAFEKATRNREQWHKSDGAEDD